MSILDKLMGRKKVEDFDAALVAIEDEIETKQAAATDLRSQVATAAFDEGLEKVRELQRSARELEDDIQVLQSVAAETVKRREAAAAADTKETVEKRLAKAEQDRTSLIKEWNDFGEHVAALQATIPRMQALSESIRVANELARTSGFSHLQFRLPGTNWSTLSSQVQQLNSVNQHDVFAEQDRVGRARVG